MSMSVDEPLSPEEREVAERLAASQTFRRACALAKSLPACGDIERAKGPLAIFLGDVAEAVDAGRIEFADSDSRTMVYALLAVCAGLALGEALHQVDGRSMMH